MSDLIKHIAGLSPAQRELLLQRLQEQKGDALPVHIPRQRRESNSFSLSFAQQRLWFLDQLARYPQPLRGRGNDDQQLELTSYNICRAMVLHGLLDQTALERSLNEIIRRHEALRTTFKDVDGQPVQVVASTLVLALPVLHLEDRHEFELKRMAREEAQQPFDLAQGPLIRTTLWRLGTEKHVLLLTVHHIIFDGWSMGVLLRELAILYDAFCTGTPSPLSELPLQYVDFAVWQRQWQDPQSERQRQGGIWEEQLAYWKQHLNGAPTALALPTDYPQAPMQTFRGAIQTHTLPERLAQALVALSQREGVTLFVTLLAAFHVLLYRYTGQHDLVIGTPIANRHRPEVKDLIGFFANTLALRTSLAGNPTFRELLTRVRTVAFEAYAHQDLPFEQVVETLQPERNLNHTPLFQVMFTLQHEPAETFAMKDVVVHLHTVDTGTAPYTLTLSLEQQAERLNVGVQYNTDLFNADTIRRMVKHFQTVLAGIVMNPAQHLAELPLLQESERQLMLIAWNATQVMYPKSSMCQLFEAQVERSPDAVALIMEGKALSYRELNRRANQLAQYLRSLETLALSGGQIIGSQLLVGLFLERSQEMVVALLGVLKAGGAYLPLDPTYPQERLALMLADARPPVLLIQQRLRERLPTYDGHLISLDTAWPFIEQQSEEHPPYRSVPEQIAYVIYTSGSTGLPKGVCISQQSLLNHCQAVAQHYGLQASDRVLQFASLSFDVAAEELFPSLVLGATVVLSPEREALTLTDFSQFLVQECLTVVNLPASFWQMWIDELERSQLPVPPALRMVIVGSEQVSSDHLKRWRKMVGEGVQWYNAYGVTEGTITATFYSPTTNKESFTHSSVPIGGPIANVQVYILDPWLQPVPIGVPGELYIGGAGLAQGYLHHPELTAERFIPDPFSSKPGMRLYKTGDATRYLPDTSSPQIEFLGRLDQQVKLRGFRIELGEIEAALNQHPNVQHAVALVHGKRTAEQRLMAYVVLKEVSSTLFTIREVRRTLEKQLPNYMLPSVILPLDALPLLPNGKVDRQALLRIERTTDERDEFAVAPRNPIEDALLGIWANLLGREQVGINDNFFELGGHSLLATQIVSRLRTILQVEVPLRALFETPTIAGLAAQITALQHTQQGLPLPPPLLPTTHTGSLPLSFAQQRLWFLDRWQPGGSLYNIPSVLRLKGQLQQEALEQSMSEIIARHEVLHTSFTLYEGQPVQVIHPPTPFHLPLVDVTHLDRSVQAGEVQRLVIREAQEPFDLTQSPLIRARLLRLASQEHLLLLTMHHIVSDGWSSGVLVHELASLYAVFVKGAASPLSPLPIQYADFARWQRDWLQGDVLHRQLAYWKVTLAGAPSVLALPTDYPRPAVQRYRGAFHRFQVPQPLYQGLLHLSQREGVTLFMTLLAAFEVMLARYSGQAEIVVGTPIANRTHGELEGLIGFFVNMLVLRSDLSGNPRFRELLARVREVALGAYAHQDVPFEQLVEVLQPERELSHSPLFQVAFVLQNAPLPAFQLQGVSVEPVEVESGTAKYDLTLFVREQQGELLGAWEYNRELFAPQTIGRMEQHWQQVLAGVVAAPAQRLADLPLLTPQEREQILEWNVSTVAYTDDRCLHALFEVQVAQAPEAIALIFEDHHLTYKELNQRANQLAYYLRHCDTHPLPGGQSMGPEAHVGVYLERSLELVIALLAVLKAGAAYIPLDVNYPAERLAFMLADAQVFTLLTQEHLLAQVPKQLEMHVICLDRDWEHFSRQPATNPIHEVGSMNLAYVIYTSGSTGIPKGVAVSHANVVRLLTTTQDQFHFDAHDVWTLFHSVAFDFSVWELWGALLYGGQLVIVPYLVTRSPEAFLALLKRRNVTVLNQTPSAFRQLMHAEKREETVAGLALRMIIFGGEALDTASLAPWFERYSYLAHQQPPLTEAQWSEAGYKANVSSLDEDGNNVPQLVNMYGITETTVHVTYHPVTSENGSGNGSMIGRPIADMQVYVLDHAMQLAPIGVIGELYVGGAGVARGYLHRPDLTAERFLPHPFSEMTGARLYKTGDVGRYLASGEIEYLGRNDQQVKIRGFRIELGEIETLLSQHPFVQEAMVLVQDETSTGQRLIAYVVPVQHTTLSNSDLRHFLRQHLPNYMLPSIFVQLEKFPLTTNGKLDRRALPSPDDARDGTMVKPGETFEEPQTELERSIALIWQEFLPVQKVGLHNNFFELGGHSLLIIQVHNRLRENLHLDVSIVDLFTYPTVYSLARHLGSQRREEETSRLPVARAEKRTQLLKRQQQVRQTKS